MALNEEDYLDKLLKSVTDGEDSSMKEIETEASSDLEELSDAEGVVGEPETFEEPEVDENHEESEEYSDLVVSEESEETVNTMGIDGSMSIDEFMSAMAVNSERYEEAENNNDDTETEFEDELVDEYIKKVLSLDEDFVPSAEVDTENEESHEYVEEQAEDQVEEPAAGFTEESVEDTTEETHYIDMTNEQFVDADDLINQLDDIFSDSTMEIQEEQVDETELQVDDELKDLLGMNEEPEPVKDEESSGLSAEDLMRIASIEEEVANEVAQEELMPDKSEIAQEVENSEVNETEELAELLGLLSENGIDMKNEADLSEDLNEAENVQDSNDKKDDDKSEPKKASKENFLSKILASFKKKANKDKSINGDNENQKVLDELFDENGELLGDEKKAKKKGLFSKTIKASDSMVEITEGDFGGVEFGTADFGSIPDLSDETADGKNSKKKKEKIKKEKPKKEKKSKPKKAPKPKIKKEKRPVAPHEIITVKPRGVFIVLIFVAAISTAAYLFPKMFSYNQALDAATYYLVDKKYTFAYEAIAGVKPTKEEDIALVEQIETIMMVQKQYNSYERYVKMNLQFEALDSLIKGIGKYDEYVNKAVEIGVGDDIENIKALIVNELWQQYGITEDMARSYGLITDYEQYSYILESYGGRIDDSNN